MGNICPKCGYEYTGRPALSRKDNRTEICPDCGMREALNAWRESILTRETEEDNGQRKA